MSSSSERICPSMRALVKPRVRKALQLLLELALPAAHDGRQDVDARVLRIRHHQIDNAVERLRRDFAAAVRAVRDADVGKEQAQVVVDLGDGPDRRSRVGARGLLLDGDGRRQALDQVDVRLLHLLEKLTRVGRQRLHIAALPFGIQRVEGQRRLARARQPGDDHQLVAGNIDVDFLEVVHARAAHRDPVVRHDLLRGFRTETPNSKSIVRITDARKHREHVATKDTKATKKASKEMLRVFVPFVATSVHFRDYLLMRVAASNADSRRTRRSTSR